MKICKEIDMYNLNMVTLEKKALRSLYVGGNRPMSPPSTSSKDKFKINSSSDLSLSWGMTKIGKWVRRSYEESHLVPQVQTKWGWDLESTSKGVGVGIGPSVLVGVVIFFFPFFLTFYTTFSNFSFALNSTFSLCTFFYLTHVPF